MGFRFILVIVAIIAIGLIARHLIHSQRKKMQPPEQPQQIEENIVACKTCGLHLPKSSAIEHNGDYYCCQEHHDSQ